MRDLYPWYSPGLKPNRTWVYGPSRDVLQYRLNTVVAESNPEIKSKLFYESRDANLRKTKAPLPAASKAKDEPDTYQNTRAPFLDETFIPHASLVRVGYHSFDRQWVIADSRLINDSRPPLWEARIQGQVYLTELHTEYPRKGPGLSFAGLLPDMHHFRGSGGGRVLPMLNPDGTMNLAPGLLEALNVRLGGGIKGDQVTAYVAGITGHPGYVRTFDDELHTPGVRVPLTGDRELWDRAVTLGRKVLWCHTYGLAGQWGDNRSVTSPTPDLELPRYERSMGSKLPSGPVSYDETAHILHLGAGAWKHVSPAVRRYTVGGTNVIDAWVDKRTESPGGNKKSPLDYIVAEIWEPTWSTEFTELLCALTRVVSLELEQVAVLEAVLIGPLLSRDELTKHGVSWPPAGKSVNPPRA